MDWTDSKIYKLGLVRFQLYARMIHFLEVRYKGVCVTAPELKKVEGNRYKLSVKSSKLIGEGGISRRQLIIRKARRVGQDWELEAVDLTSSRDIILELDKEQLPTTIQGRLLMQGLII